MTNQSKQQNNAQQIQFENLKTLQAYLAKGGDIQSFAISLARSKKALETFCKALKDKDVILSKTEQVAKKEPVVEVTESASKTEVTTHATSSWKQQSITFALFSWLKASLRSCLNSARKDCTKIKITTRRQA